MMFPYSSFGFPYYNRYSRYGYRYPYYAYNGSRNSSHYSSDFKKKSDAKRKQDNNQVHDTNSDFAKSIDRAECKDNKKANSITEDEDIPLFQLFGINLYFDDILLICLIFFLYQEGVKDDSLFIALILLLLS